jgi:cold shock protein
MADSFEISSTVVRNGDKLAGGPLPLARKPSRELGITHRTNYAVVVVRFYGFIQPQGGGKDVFVHISAVERAGLTSLNEGQTVQYEIESNRGKESAVNLKVSK